MHVSIQQTADSREWGVEVGGGGGRLRRRYSYFKFKEDCEPNSDVIRSDFVLDIIRSV
jgi:hypothetical protein